MNQNMYSIEPENNLTTENCHISGKNTEIYSTLHLQKKLKGTIEHLVTPPYNKHEQKKKKGSSLSGKLMPCMASHSKFTLLPNCR